jgi:uncharacterized membrane protein YhaH (DUF805 family)
MHGVSHTSGPAPDLPPDRPDQSGGRLGPVDAVRTVLRKTFTWSGRARRSEFWWWALAGFAVYCAAITVELQLDPSGDSVVITGITWFALLLPTLAVTVRRLHDRSFSAWWLLLNLLPFGLLVVLVLCAFDSWAGPNQYGPDPKGRPGPASRPDAIAPVAPQ